jgi:hypothetical protein
MLSPHGLDAVDGGSSESSDSRRHFDSLKEEVMSPLIDLSLYGMPKTFTTLFSALFAARAKEEGGVVARSCAAITKLVSHGYGDSIRKLLTLTETRALIFCARSSASALELLRFLLRGGVMSVRGEDGCAAIEATLGSPWVGPPEATLRVLQLLLEYGAAVPDPFPPPLVSAMLSRIELLQYALKAGYMNADSISECINPEKPLRALQSAVDEAIHLSNSFQMCGRPELSVVNGSLEIVSCLLEAGARPTASAEGVEIPILVYAIIGKDVAEKVVGAGGVANLYGLAPCQWPICAVIVELLRFQRVFEQTSTEFFGMTAGQWASYFGCHDISSTIFVVQAARTARK